jgi:ABC-type Fe3+ transport system permease subunit
MPVPSAVLGLSLILFMNALSLMVIIDLLGFTILTKILESNPTETALVLGFGVFVMNLAWIYHKNRYQEIIKSFSKRSENQRKRGARITLFYALASIIALFILAPLRVM